MHSLALIPWAFAVTAFVLSMLCIFAGSKPGYMENAALLTVNSSMIGDFAFNTSSSSSSGSSGGGLLGDLENDLHNLKNDIESDIEKALAAGAHDIAEAIGVHDFYSFHLRGFCEGFYEPGAVVNSTNPNPSENITYCSNQTAFFTFQPGDIIQSELIPGVNLSFLHWPNQVEEAVQDVKDAVNAMFVLYCIGAAFAGLAMISATVTLFLGGTLSIVVNSMIDFVAFIALAIASIIATVAIDKICGAINEYATDIGVVAYKGTTFLAFTWVSTALMGLASLAWAIDCCLGRRKRINAVRNGKSSRI